MPISVVLDNARYQRCKAVIEHSLAIGVDILTPVARAKLKHLFVGLQPFAGNVYIFVKLPGDSGYPLS